MLISPIVLQGQIMIIVIGSIVVKPDERSKALSIALEHVQRSQKEPGCISHNVSVDCENALRFVFVENWADMAALKDHFALEDSQKFVRDLTPLVAAKPEMKIYDANAVVPV